MHRLLQAGAFMTAQPHVSDSLAANGLSQSCRSKWHASTLHGLSHCPSPSHDGAQLVQLDQRLRVLVRECGELLA